jgi:Ca2+-binding RTX toxin-like protein
MISIGPAVVSQAEGDFGTTEYTFNLTREGDLSQASAVFVTFDAGDTDSNDFGGDLPDPILVLFQANEDEQSVTYSVSGDLSIEADETFTVSLDMPVGATIDPAASSATGTIINDDEESDSGDPTALPVIALDVGRAQFFEGDQGTIEIPFGVVRAGKDLSGTSTVDVAFVPGDTNADDFGGTLPETVTVTFAPGETRKTVDIAVSGDIDPESDETFGLRLEFPTGAVIDSEADSSFATIFNDDEIPPITGTAEDDTILVDFVSDGVTGGVPSDADDTISALAGADEVDGGGGDDTIDGGTGDDDLGGGDGDDRLFGNDGEDDLKGGDGDDLLLGGERLDFLDGEDGQDVLVGGEGNDNLQGGEGRDILFGGSGWDVLNGGDDDDYLNGGGDTDFLNGGNGDDIIEGGEGIDLLIGGDGEDFLDGGAGNDRLEAGFDRDGDTLTGGAGNDKFVFGGANGDDLITDFTDGEDIIDLSAYNRVDDVEDFDINQDGDSDNVVISGYDGSDSFILVENANVEDFTNDDFSFA